MTTLTTREEMAALLRDVVNDPEQSEYVAAARIFVRAREVGASLRSIAHVLQWSKSTLHREAPRLQAVGAVARGGDPHEAADTLLSHLGQEAEKEASNGKGPDPSPVPSGTRERCPHCGGAL